MTWVTNLYLTHFLNKLSLPFLKKIVGHKVTKFVTCYVLCKTFESLITNQPKRNLQDSSLIQCMLVLNTLEGSRQYVEKPEGSRRIQKGPNRLMVFKQRDLIQSPFNLRCLYLDPSMEINMWFTMFNSFALHLFGCSKVS